MAAPDNNTIHEIAALLADAESVLFVTGVGLSAASGVPTYRGVNGLYEVSDNEDGYPIEVSFSAQMLELRPEIAWKHIARAESACRKASPNRAYEIIASFQERISRLWVFTQNIDGLHRAAGSKNVLEMNGNLRHLACMDCHDWYTVDDYTSLSLPPRCGRCNGIIRPEIVLFGELVSNSVLDRIEDEMERGFDLIFLVGTVEILPDLVTVLEEAADMGAVVVDLHDGPAKKFEFVEHYLNTDMTACLESIWKAG